MHYEWSNGDVYVVHTYLQYRQYLYQRSCSCHYCYTLRMPCKHWISISYCIEIVAPYATSDFHLTCLNSALSLLFLRYINIAESIQPRHMDALFVLQNPWKPRPKSHIDYSTNHWTPLGYKLPFCLFMVYGFVHHWASISEKILCEYKSKRRLML